MLELSNNPEQCQISGVNQRLLPNTKSIGQTNSYQCQNPNNTQGQNQGVQALTPSSQFSRNQSNIVKGLPITSTVSKNVPTRLSDAGSNFGSPIPCGDSFFEDDAVLTQTHVDFMSKFKRHSIPGSSNTSSSNINSPTSNFSSPVVKRQFSDLVGLDFQQSLNKTSNKPAVGSQNRPICLNQSDSFISPNTFKSTNVVTHNDFNDNFDSIDDELNLELAEQSDFEFDYKISSANHSASTKKSTEITGKGNNFGISNTQKGDYCEKEEGNYRDIANQSGDDLFDIEDFDEEDFGEVLEYDTLPKISHTPRTSTGSTGEYGLDPFLQKQI